MWCDEYGVEAGPRAANTAQVPLTLIHIFTVLRVGNGCGVQLNRASAGYHCDIWDPRFHHLVASRGVQPVPDSTFSLSLSFCLWELRCGTGSAEAQSVVWQTRETQSGEICLRVRQRLPMRPDDNTSRRWPDSSLSGCLVHHREREGVAVAVPVRPTDSVGRSWRRDVGHHLLEADRCLGPARLAALRPPPHCHGDYSDHYVLSARIPGLHAHQRESSRQVVRGVGYVHQRGGSAGRARREERLQPQGEPFVPLQSVGDDLRTGGHAGRLLLAWHQQREYERPSTARRAPTPREQPRLGLDHSQHQQRAEYHLRGIESLNPLEPLR